MSRRARLIIYESDDEESLNKQIEKSLPEGEHHLAVKITIKTLSSELTNSIIISDSLLNKD